MPALTALQALRLLFRSIETSPAASRRIVQSLSCEAGIKLGHNESTSPPLADFMNLTFCRLTRIELSACFLRRYCASSQVENLRRFHCSSLIVQLSLPELRHSTMTNEQRPADYAAKFFFFSSRRRHTRSWRATRSIRCARSSCSTRSPSSTRS